MKKSHAGILLVFVFMARGTSFLFSKELLGSMSPMSILAVRFILAFVILALIFFKKLRHCDKRSLRGGVILGVLYTVCMVLEMYGLRMIDTGICSLIENMAIVLVPVYAAVLTKCLPKKKTVMCALLAVVGVGFLSLAQSQVNGSAPGIVLAILAALTYGACIMATERVSQDADPITVGVIQLGVMGTLSLIIALPTGTFAMPQTGNQWLLLMMLVLLCSCFGFAFQPMGQKYLSVEAAAIFTVINPLTASVLGILAAGESITAPKMTGYSLILISLVIFNVNIKRKRIEDGKEKI